MPGRKRVKEEEEEVTTPEKRLKPSPSARRSTRNSTSKEPTSDTKGVTANGNGKQSRSMASKAPAQDSVEVLSDSSSLSDPPSVIHSPSPPSSSPFKKMIQGTASKIAAVRKATQVKKPSSKEHEEALNLFVREDDSEDDDSDVSPSKTKPINDMTNDLSGSDEDEDWEDVDLSHKRQVSLNDLNPVEETPDLEVTLERTQQSMRIKNKASSVAERKIRMHTHLLHVQCLLFHGAIRNNWLQDSILRKELLSRFPDLSKAWKKLLSSDSEGDKFVALLDKTAERFRSQFTITKPGLRKVGYRDLSMVDKEDEAKYFEKFERFDNIESFRAAAKELKGSRDFGAQLFTALLRALGIEARLIFSLQPLGFNFGKQEDAHRLDRKKDDLSKDVQEIDTPETPPKKRKRRKMDDEDEDEEDLGLPKVKSKATGPDSDLKFPIFWSEVYVGGKWVPVDALVLTAVANSPKDLELFEPKGKVAEDKKLVMGYVVAYDGERFVKDVTVRYVKNFPGKAKRWRTREFTVRGANGETVMYDWFKRTLGIFRRTEKTDRDEIEDLELQVKPPTPKEVNIDSLSYYKNHPKYVLERHLRREEALKPESKPVRTFTSGKGEKAREEVVYSRADVYICRTVENWYKEGKKVKEGEAPMKQVKARPMTLTRKREHELAMAENDDQPIMEGLYAAHQVEVYRPPPIVDGIIPKNGYGNIDLFVDSMLPEGAVHLPCNMTVCGQLVMVDRGIVRVVKKLGIDYSEAITGFEFRKMRAIPVVFGVVVASEHEEMVLDAWREEEALRAEKEATKKQKEVLARWKKFLVGLRIRKRIGIVYGDTTEEAETGS